MSGEHRISREVSAILLQLTPRSGEQRNYKQKSDDYEPLPIVGETGGAAILKSLLKVHFLRAQRHLDDPGSGGRTEQKVFRDD